MIELKPFQAKGVRTIDHYQGVLLLADEMRLGKTIQSLFWLKKHPEKRPAIITVPAHLRWQWEDEARVGFGLRAVTLTGLKPFKLRPSITPIVIVGYDILSQRSYTRDGKTKKYKGWLQELMELQAKVLIWDEAQYCKDRASKRTKAIMSLSRGVECRLALSGTPLTSRPAELWPTLNSLWPEEFPNFFAYAHRYCKAVRTPWGWDFKGASRLEELHQRLKDMGMVRRRKIDVLTDLPPKQRTVIPVDIPMKNYEQACSDFLGWLSASSPDKAEKASKAEQVTKIGYLIRLAAEEKLPQVVQWINDFLEGSEEKLAVYGIHRSVVRALHNLFPKISVCIDGDVPQNKRKDLIWTFQNKPKCRLFFGNMVAAGTGVGIAAADSLLFAELSWIPGDHTQVEDRIIDINKTRQVTAYYMVAKDTIEEELCRINQNKQQVISQTLDGGKNLRGDLDIFTQLTNYLKAKTKRKGAK